MSVKDGKLTIIANRGTGRFIVQEEGAFYLADLYEGVALKAEPPESADIFLRSSYFYDTDEVEPGILIEIREAMQHKKENPAKQANEKR